jgi:hypothetical protein
MECMYGRQQVKCVGPANVNKNIYIVVLPYMYCDLKMQHAEDDSRPASSTYLYSIILPRGGG